MREQTTPTSVVTQASPASRLYVGIDVHKRNWKVSIYGEVIEHKTFSQDPDPAILERYLRQNFPTAEVHIAYEAGFSGFWIAQYFLEHQRDCIVTNPADIPTTDKERRFKNDTRDARRLAQRLRSQDLTAIYVPTAQALDDRQLVRTRQALVKKQTRVKNQIKGLLAMHGIVVPKHSEQRHWSRPFLTWLEGVGIDRPVLHLALASHLRELDALRANIVIVTKEITTLSHSDRYRQRVEWLVSAPGIGSTGAMILLTELIDIHRFSSLDKLACFIGLVPGTHSSGETEITTGLSHRGNKSLLYVLIEATWVAVRHDPVLHEVFESAARRMPKNRAIIVAARRLLSRIFHVLTAEEPYQINHRATVVHQSVSADSNTDSNSNAPASVMLRECSTE